MAESENELHISPDMLSALRTNGMARVQSTFSYGHLLGEGEVIVVCPIEGLAEEASGSMPGADQRIEAVVVSFRTAVEDPHVKKPGNYKALLELQVV